MRITIYRNIGKEEAIQAITAKEKGRRAKEKDHDFFHRILPKLKGKSFPLNRGK
jgi:hypothetical protein